MQTCLFSLFLWWKLNSWHVSYLPLLPQSYTHDLWAKANFCVLISCLYSPFLFSYINTFHYNLCSSGVFYIFANFLIIWLIYKLGCPRMSILRDENLHSHITASRNRFSPNSLCLCAFYLALRFNIANGKWFDSFSAKAIIQVMLIYRK